MFLFRCFGNPSLEGENGELVPARATQRHRLALLTLLAVRPAGWTRDKLMALLWPESPVDRARSSLNESVYVLRGTLGDGALISVGEELRLGVGLRTDIAEFAGALARGDPEAAVAWYRAPFLDGFFLNRALEFERWVERERERLAREYRAALEQIAMAAAASGDANRAVEWRRRLAAESPYDARAAIGLMQALEYAGDRVAALEHARVYRRLLHDEFGVEPDPDLVALEHRVRTGVVPSDGRATVPSPPSPPGPSPEPDATQPTRPVRTSADGVRRRRLGIAGVAIALAAALVAEIRPRWHLPALRDELTSVSLAVLPFNVFSARASDRYLAIGIPDVITTRLAANQRIRVRPTSAILPYTAAKTDPRTIGKALAVRYVMTGTVARIDSAVQVRVQLVAVDDQAAIWGREYQLAATDLFRLQDSVAADVTGALRLAPEPHVGRTTRLRVAKGAAYDLFLEGRSHLAHHRERETRQAIAAFQRAVELDPDFALAYAALAQASAEMHLRFASVDSAREWGDNAQAMARRALELDPSLPEAHEALAAVYRKTEFDWHGTITESRRALRISPSAPMPYFYMGGALYHLGLLDDAERAVRRGLEVQPVSDRAEALRTLGTVALASGRYAEAVTLLQAVQRLSDRPVSDPHLAAAYFYAGDRARAEQLLGRLLTSPSASAATRARAMLAGIVASRGDTSRAYSLLDEAQRGSVDHHVAFGIGVAYAQLGRPADAVRWLRTASDTGFRCYPWFARDPLLAPIRGDQAFRALLAEQERSWKREARWYGSL